MRNVAVRASLVGLIVAASLSPATQGLPAADKPAPTNVNASAATKPADPAFDLFGPESLGLKPDEELRLVFKAVQIPWGKIVPINFRYELTCSGDSPRTARIWGSEHPNANEVAKPPLRVVTLNANDWRRLERLSTYCRTRLKPDTVPGFCEFTLSWSRRGVPKRQERFVCPHDRGDLLRELVRRATSAKQVQTDRLLVTSYPVGDIVAKIGGTDNPRMAVRAVVGLIYDVVPPSTWQPGNGEIRVRSREQATTLDISQTVESHQEIAQLLALLRRTLSEAAATSAVACFADQKEAETIGSLSRRVSMRCDGISLGAVIKDCETQYGLKARLDGTMMKERKVSTDTPVTFHARDISLRSALRLMLADLGLDFTIEKGTVLIGEPCCVRDHNVLAAYPVSDLAADPGRLDGVAPQDLMDAIRSCCDSWTWDEIGGTGSINCIKAGKSRFLIVAQSYEVHRQIAGLLNTLQTFRKEIGKPVFMAGVQCFNSPAEEAAHRKIANALAKKVSLHHAEESLGSFALQLSKLTGVNVLLDRRSLREGGLAEDASATVLEDDRTVRYILQHALPRIQLSYVIEDEVLRITTPEYADDCLYLVAYAVSDVDSDRLRELIVNIVNPTGWDDVGGRGSISFLSLGRSKVMLVLQNAEVHEEIADFGETLRHVIADAARGRLTLRYDVDNDRVAAMKALLRKVTLDFDRQPIDVALQSITKQYGLHVMLDEETQEAREATANKSVTVHVKDVSLAEALDAMLSPVNLGWTVRDASVVVTFVEEAETRLSTAVYPVGDLVVCRDSGGKLWDDFDTLINAIRRDIAPQTWDTVGGAGCVTSFSLGAAKTLVVTQTDSNQYRVADWLAKAHDARKQSPGGQRPNRHLRRREADAQGGRHVLRRGPEAADRRLRLAARAASPVQVHVPGVQNPARS